MSRYEPEFKVEITPDTRLKNGWFRLREVPCLRVTVVQRGPWKWLGSDTTETTDQGEARALAAEMIARWERDHSEVVL